MTRATTHAHIRSVVHMTDAEFAAYCRRIEAGIAQERTANAEMRAELRAIAQGGEA